jgi:hypothetical protein
MKLPQQRRILVEEFQQQKSWIAKLILPINKFFEDILRGLNKGITIFENMDGEVIEVETSGTYPIDIRWTRPAPPKICFLGRCTRVDGESETFTDPLYLDWEYTASGSFRIKGIPGLSASESDKYNLVLVCLIG